jgi:hypothetical protein
MGVFCRGRRVAMDADQVPRMVQNMRQNITILEHLQRFESFQIHQISDKSTHFADPVLQAMHRQGMRYRVKIGNKPWSYGRTFGNAAEAAIMEYVK